MKSPRRPARPSLGGLAGRKVALGGLALTGAALVPSVAHAAGAAGGIGGLGPVPLVLAMAALSMLPFALLMVTCFVRISVVLSILRSAIGAPQLPPSLHGREPGALEIALAMRPPIG